jgi:hypothetical protein
MLSWCAREIAVVAIRPRSPVPDTLIDEPPPPTLRDPVEPPPPEPGSPSRRASRVGIAAAILAAAIGVAAVALYLFVFHYDAVASRHIPSNANLVVRARVADIVLWKPVRDRLLPLLLERGARSGKPRGDRLRDLTGTSLSTDLREVMIASVDATSWVIVAGGRIKPGRFVDGVEKLAQEEGWTGVHREGELLILPGGVALGQADDGVLVLATDASLAKNALSRSDEQTHLDLPEDGAVTFAVTKQAWSGAAGIARVAGASVLGHVERASGRMSLGDSPVVAMVIEPAQGTTAASLAKELSELIREARLVTMLLPDVAGEKGALGAALVNVSGEHVTLTAPWPYEGLDRGIGHLTALIRALR